MISNQIKEKILSEILPNGFMYENDKHRSKLFFENDNGYYLPTELQKDFDTENDFITAVENLNRDNRDAFIIKIIRSNKIDFIDFINEQFELIKDKNENTVSYWLKSVHHHIVVNHSVFCMDENYTLKKGAFLKWYNEIVKTISCKNIESRLDTKKIALKLVYENISVTKENANDIIKKYGWTSGPKLYQQYNFYFKRLNRIANPDKTKKVLENKIELFESVVDLVADDKKQQVIDECKILKSHLSKY